MKRTLVMLLTLVLVMSSIPALAAGKLSVTQENFYVIDSYSVYGYAFARVQNVGDKPIKVNAGVMEVFDTEGDAITSTDYLNMYAEYLKPDEYTYVQGYVSIDEVGADDVDDYLLTITGKSDSDGTTMRLPCTTDYQENVNVGGYSKYNYMYATFTNDTDEPVFDINVVLALLDEEGNILYIKDASLYNDKALMPGSSMMIREYVDSSFIEVFEKQGLKPASVDAIAYATSYHY